AVRAEHADHVPRRDGEVEAVEQGPVPVPSGEVVGDEGGGHPGILPPARAPAPRRRVTACVTALAPAAHRTLGSAITHREDRGKDTYDHARRAPRPLRPRP